MTTSVVPGVLAIVLLLVVPAAVKIVQECERGVIFRLGRLVDVRRPGFSSRSLLSEPCARWTSASSHWKSRPRKPSHVTNVTIQVDAVVYFRVVSPSDAVVKAIDFVRATSRLRRRISPDPLERECRRVR